MAGSAVRLYKNDGTSTSYVVYAGDPLPSATDLGWMREGFTFVNWNTEADGSGTSYEVGDTVEAFCYAQWQENVAPVAIDYLVSSTDLTSIADAIRTKGGTSAALSFPIGFVSAINNISGGVTPSGTISISANGTYNVTSYSEAVVSVSGGSLESSFLDRTLSSYSNSQLPKLGDYAFAGCSSLKSVSLPAVSTIGKYAFMNCTMLSSINLPSVGVIAEFAFANATISEASFPVASVIGSYAFQNCVGLQKIYAPRVSFINPSAFYACSSLTNITFGSVPRIGSYVFYLCSALSTVSFPFVTQINGSYAFGQCTHLVSVSFPELLEIRANSTFYNCGSLSDIYFPKLSNISATGTFCGCSALSEISLPLVGRIPQYTFSGCTRLEKVTLGSSTSSIYSSAFAYCNSLVSLYLPGSTVCNVDAISRVFNNCPIRSGGYGGVEGYVYVPSTLVDTYRQRTNWNVISSKILSIT